MPSNCHTLYMCIKFGVDSSSLFPFIAWIHRHTKSEMPLIILPMDRHEQSKRENLGHIFNNISHTLCKWRDTFKLKFYVSSFPRSILARMPATSRACYARGLWRTTRHTALHRSRPPADQSGKRVARWTWKSPDLLQTSLLARMSGGCYAENGPVEFKLYRRHASNGDSGSGIHEVATVGVYPVTMHA